MEFLAFLFVGAFALALVGLLFMVGFNLAITVADEYDLPFIAAAFLCVIFGLGLPSACYFFGRLIMGG